MSDLFRVRVGGPLAGYREALIEEFLRFGLAESTAARHLQLMAHLSEWMSREGIGAGGLCWDDVDRFCSDHGLSGKHRYCPGVAPRSMVLLMAVLHPGGVPRGARSVGAGAAVDTDTDQLMSRFAGYLREERALAPTTVDRYGDLVRGFAGWHVEHHGRALATVTAVEVNSYLRDRLGAWSVESVRSCRTALRALLRWLFLIGLVPSDASGGVLAVRHHLQDGPPRALAAVEVEALLAVVMSARDRAIILVLLRLGLRSGEVAGLTLDDFDWRVGTIAVRGKRGDSQLMPMPDDVGRAIAAYLLKSRQGGSPRRELFLSEYPPFGPLRRVSVSAVVTRLARRAGLVGRVGSHRLRHSAATAVLSGGGTLSEAGHLLRHRSVTTTSIYARVDFGSLGQVARPWPVSDLGGGSDE